MSLLSASTLAGAALGPFPGGYIAEALTPVLFGYRATFYISGLVQILVGVYAFFLIRGRGLATAQAAPTSRGVSLYALALRHKGVAVTSLAVFLFGLSYGAFLYFTVPLLGESLGFGPVRIGWIISSFGFGHVIGSLVMGPLSDKMGRRKPFVFLAQMLGIFVGPIFGGLILGIWGFSTALVAYAAITIVGSLIFLFSVREPVQPARSTGAYSVSGTLP